MPVRSPDDTAITGTAIDFVVQNEQRTNALLTLSTANSTLSASAVSSTKIVASGIIPASFGAGITTATKFYFYVKLLLPNARSRIASDYRGEFTIEPP